MSDVRCVNPDCRVLNRVGVYSVNQIPRCPKCGWVLPEQGVTRILRGAYKAHPVMWVALGVGIIVIGFSFGPIHTKTWSGMERNQRSDRRRAVPLRVCGRDFARSFRWMALGTKVTSMKDTTDSGTSPDNHDAEFKEYDDLPVRRSQIEPAEVPSYRTVPERQRSNGPIHWSFFFIVLGAVAYSFFYHTSTSTSAPDAFPVGWLDLANCSDTVSLDGKRWLSLSSDQTVELSDRSGDASKTVSAQPRAGKWTYDPSSRRYAVTLDGQITNYSVLFPDNVATCILVKGDLDKANLIESWFSTAEEERGTDHEW